MKNTNSSIFFFYTLYFEFILVVQKIFLQIFPLHSQIKLYILWVVEGKFSTGHALALARVEPSQQVSVYRRILVPCKLNHKEFEEVLRYLGDLAMKDEVPIGEVLRWPEIAAILEGEPGDARRRGTDLRFALKRLRYPRLSAVERQFTRALKAARLGEGVRLSPPRFFEGEFLDLAFRARSPDDLEKLAGILHRLRNEGRIEALFRILREP